MKGSLARRGEMAHKGSRVAQHMHTNSTQNIWSECTFSDSTRARDALTMADTRQEDMAQHGRKDPKFGQIKI